MKLRMLQGYCYSDFSFYSTEHGGIDVTRNIFDMLQGYGAEFEVVGSYTRKWKTVDVTEMVNILKNGECIIESPAYGWETVPEAVAIEPVNEYTEFYDRLAEVMNTSPAGCSRWANDVLEMFGNEFEEDLYPEGDA